MDDPFHGNLTRQMSFSQIGLSLLSINLDKDTKINRPSSISKESLPLICPTQNVVLQEIWNLSGTFSMKYTRKDELATKKKKKKERKREKKERRIKTFHQYRKIQIPV